MTFFQVDDQLTNNFKVRTLIEESMAGDVDGFAALGLWTAAGSQIQASLTDGVIRRPELIRLTLNPQIADALARRLVSAGLWHDAGHDCSQCPPVGPDEFLFHQWRQFSYDTGEQVRTSRDKRKELKDPFLIEQVWRRDCTDPQSPTVGRCRYCSRVVRRADRRSEDARPEMDHVDPTLAVGVRNVVLSCRACNRRKGRNRPEERGMTLLPAPTHSADVVELATVSPPPGDAGAVSPDSFDSPGPPPAWAVEPQEPVSPPEGAAETSTASTTAKAPEMAAQEPQEQVSPPPGDAETRLASAADQTPTNLGSDPDQTPIKREELSPCGRAGAHGHGEGLGKGSGTGSAGQGSGRKRRRRRGRGKSKSGSPQGRPQDQVPRVGSLDAGAAPEVGAGEVAGRWGSPWQGWSGPASDVTETTCLEHGIEMPCWKCEDESED